MGVGIKLERIFALVAPIGGVGLSDASAVAGVAMPVIAATPAFENRCSLLETYLAAASLSLSLSFSHAHIHSTLTAPAVKHP